MGVPERARSKPGELGFKDKTMLDLTKADRALDLRKMGASYPEIAKSLGYSNPTMAHAAVKRAMQQSIQEKGAELIDLYVQRLDYFLIRLQERIRKGEPRAIEVALKIEERRAILLGLDAAQRVEHSFDGPITVEYYRDDRQGSPRTEIIDLISESIAARGVEEIPALGPPDPSHGVDPQDHGDRGRDGIRKDVDRPALGP